MEATVTQRNAQVGPFAQLSAVEPTSNLFLASVGEDITDWEATRDEFCSRLVAIMSSWDLHDASSYISQVQSFDAPPHTAQRLAELLKDPQRWYKDSAKFCRALIKVLSVTSTTIDFSNDKETSSMAFEDSLLVPIPWLTANSVSGPEISQTQVAAVNNGYKPDTSDAFPPATAPLGGSAPIDAADYGPQSVRVQETIASNSIAHESTPREDDSNDITMQEDCDLR